MRVPTSKLPIIFLIPLLGMVMLNLPIFAEDSARLSATSLVLEQTDDGAVLTLEGPVEVVYKGDSITAESAVVTLGDDLSALTEAISRIDLTGGIIFSGRNGSSGRANQATYYAQENRIIFHGGVDFNQGGFSATAGSVDYSIGVRQVNLVGHCTLKEGDISASAGSAEYDLTTRAGELSGSVEVRYRIDEVLFGDDVIQEINFRAQKLIISAAENRVMTPVDSSGGRPIFVAGNFTLKADNVDFRVTESDLNRVSVSGNVNLTGPDIHVNADSLSLSTADRILRADGNVGFSIMGQDGRAESIEVNFTTGWSIRMVGGSVGGTIEELDNDDENSQSDEESDSG